MHKLIMSLMLVTLTAVAEAQLFRKVAENAKNKVENKAVQKSGDKIDDILNGKKKEKKTGDDDAANNSSPAVEASGPASMAIYSKFDFIPGETVIALEDFSQDAVGDFPARWNTNASGEVVTADGLPGKWLKLDATGVFMPEFINKLPENVTIEFDLVCNREFRYEASPFHFGIAQLAEPQHYTRWMQGSGGRKGFNAILQPLTPSRQKGRAGFELYNDQASDDGIFETSLFHAPSKNKVHVSIWRQKQRVRVYLDQEKLIDVARALSPGDYNTLVISLTTAVTKPDYYLFSNLRVAVGAPDTRNKLLTDGKFVTTGILFDVNSDRIQPSSFAVLKEIAGVMKDNAELRIRITGHTDSDGSATANQQLSEKRAAAVKAALAREFKIDESRMETAGKGESALAVPEKSAADKANNRRVEFTRI